jgi:uncharacterized CHY-type Zn-finger protein
MPANTKATNKAVVCVRCKGRRADMLDVWCSRCYQALRKEALRKADALTAKAITVAAQRYKDARETSTQVSLCPICEFPADNHCSVCDWSKKEGL